MIAAGHHIVIGLPELLVMLLLLGLPGLVALYDILRSDFVGNNKTIWVIVVILLPLVGTMFYLLIGRRQKSTSTASPGKTDPGH